MQNTGSRNGVISTINWTMRPLKSFVGEMKKFEAVSPGMLLMEHSSAGAKDQSADRSAVLKL